MQVRHECLVHGYLKQEFKASKYINISSLTGIILTLLGNILLHFDIFHEDRKDEVLDGGMRIKRTTGRSSLFASSFYFNSGVNEFKIKCINPHFDTIGIISDTTDCAKNQWITQINSGIAYYYYNYIGIEKTPSGRTIHRTSTKWKNDDIITVRIDCEKWIVAFYLNDEQIGRDLKIKPNSSYHPVLGTNTDKDAEYGIVGWTSI